MTHDLPALLTIQEVADYFRIHPVTVHKMINDGHLRTIRTSPFKKHAMYRIPVEDVRNFIDMQNQSK